MKKTSTLFFAWALLAGCGANNLQPAAKPVPKDNPQRSTCPNGTFTNVHSLELSFTRGYPEKLGIKLNGDKDFRYSDCTRVDQKGVQVSVSREVNRTLVVKVDHNNVFTNNGLAPLPKNQDIEIFDLKNCVTEPVSFWKKTVTLDWAVEYPNGLSCPSHAVGSYKETVPDIEAAPIEGSSL